MTTRKYIYWRSDIEKEEAEDGKLLANIHLLVHNQCSLANFQHMAVHFRKSFPDVTDDQLYCGKILKSSSFMGYSIMIWNSRIKIQNYPNWLERDFDKIEYLW